MKNWVGCGEHLGGSTAGESLFLFLNGFLIEGRTRGLLEALFALGFCDSSFAYKNPEYFW